MWLSQGATLMSRTAQEGWSSYALHKTAPHPRFSCRCCCARPPRPRPCSIPLPRRGDNPSYTLRWSPMVGVTSYLLEQATSSAFVDATQVYAGTATEYVAASAGIATYYYRVGAHYSSGGSNWSNVQSVPVYWELEPNGDAAEATRTGPLQPGAVHYGVLTGADSCGNDYFYFDLPSSRPVELWLTHMTGDQDFNLVLRDASLHIVPGGFSGNPGSSDDHVVTASLPAGRYYVQVNRVTGNIGQPYHLRGTW